MEPGAVSRPNRESRRHGASAKAQVRRSLLAMAVTLSAVLSIPAARAQPAAGAAEAESIWVTLGTGGGPVIRQKRSEPANALVVGKSVYLFDVGAGSLHRLAAANLPLNQVRAIFISHHHPDHNAGLAPLLMHRWLGNAKSPVVVLGPNGTGAMTTGILAAGRATELAPVIIGEQKMPLAQSAVGRDNPMETPQPVEVYRDENIRVLAVINTHFHFPAGSPEALASRSYSYRVEAPGRIIVYSGDTGPSEAVTRLAEGADLLVSEVVDLEAMSRVGGGGAANPQNEFMRHMREDHLAPEEVGKIAAQARVKQVILTHLVPGFDNETSTAGYADGVRRLFKGPVVVAEDLQRF